MAVRFRDRRDDFLFAQDFLIVTSVADRTKVQVKRFHRPTRKAFTLLLR
jgi:hypothetical protein